MLPQHRWRAYPPAYSQRQSLFFLFTVTRSENRLPLESWLDDGQVLNLEPHQSAQEIGQFMQQVMGYHSQAYGYEVDERQRQVRRAAAEHLALGMKGWPAQHPRRRAADGGPVRPALSLPRLRGDRAAGRAAAADAVSGGCDDHTRTPD
jgi:hypothetical protein